MAPTAKFNCSSKNLGWSFKQGFIDADGFDGGDGQLPALEATQGQMDGFFRQLLYKCHLEVLESVAD